MKYSIRFLFFFIPLCIGVAVIVQLIVSNEMVGVSNRLYHTNKRISEIEKQNAVLKQHIIQLSSIQRISESGNQLGLRHASAVYVFTQDAFPVAIKR